MNKNSIFSSSTDVLTGKLLVAMPQLMDPRFTHAVILVCGHDKQGAMGLVLNRLIDSLTLQELLDQLNIQTPLIKEEIPIHFGGPVEMGRGFILHSTDYLHKASVKINEDIALTATVDILNEIASGHGPQKKILALGYTGWSAGQLETELQQNSWLLVEADLDLIFTKELELLWKQVLNKMGIDPELLSLESGHA
ncbi:MAG: hypothetical protein BGO76_06005 [Caedibacter sp. 38-128]|nr:YqgE/AlgH family protein [Holosporales bacterium]OJX08802.1 MAG: hypothetical protein BGO76_06005 [Caedibacter sp. 38-128]